MTAERTVTLGESTLLPGTQLQDCAIEVIEGPDRGQRFPLEPGRTVIGASSRCDVTLGDPTISSRHAQLTLLPDGIGLEDLGSKNGTRLLGSRVNSIVIQVGATFDVGQTRLALVPPSSEAQPLERDHYAELIGNSVAWRRVFATLERLERSEATVLIQGETGVGKSAVARAIHQRSARGARELATIDCGAISPSLLASELFGHARGAFTGADRDRVGIVGAAAGSTLLLEEIGDLPLELQPMLLRLLEGRRYTRVGETQPRTADVRALAATHHDLKSAVAAGTFRADLFYRLSVITIRVPPLRECREEIVPLAERFLVQQGLSPELTPGQRALLEGYGWPGNARQLRNAVERFAATGDFFDTQCAPAPRWGDGDFHSSKAELIRRFERDYLVRLLRECTGNLSAAARKSGLARNHLHELIKRHGIDLAPFRS